MGFGRRTLGLWAGHAEHKTPQSVHHKWSTDIQGLGFRVEEWLVADSETRRVIRKARPADFGTENRVIREPRTG